MKRDSKKILSFVMATMMGINYSPIYANLNSYAAEEASSIELSGQVVGNTFELKSDSANANEFFNDILYIYVGNHEDVSQNKKFEKNNGDLHFKVEGNKVVLNNSSYFQFKKTKLSITTSNGRTTFEFINPDGKSYADGVEIEGLEFGITGKDEYVNGQNLGEKAKTFSMSLYYDFESQDNRLFELVKRVEKVNIDGIDYKMYDDAGRPNFILFEGKFSIYDKYDEGKKAIADIEKRNAHKAIITFEDGSTVSKEDTNYVEPTRDNENTNPPSNGGENPSQPNTGAEDPVNENGIATPYKIYSAEINSYNELEMKVAKKENESEAIKSATISRVTHVKINGQKFPTTSIRVNWADKTLISNVDGDRDIIAKVKANRVVNIELIFDDNSVIKYTMQNPNAPEEPSTGGGSSEPSQPSKPQDEDPINENGIATPYKIYSAKINSDDELEFIIAKKENENEIITDALIKSLKNIKINGQKFVSDTIRINWAGKTLISDVVPDKEIIAKAKAENPVKIEFVFNDNSVISYTLEKEENTQNPPQGGNGGNAGTTPTPNPGGNENPGGNNSGNTGETPGGTNNQDEEKIAPKYQITKAEVSFSSFTAVLDKMMPFTETSKIVSVTVNGKKFLKKENSNWSYSRITDGIRFSDADIVAKAQEHSPISVQIEFEDGSILDNGVELPARAPELASKFTSMDAAIKISYSVKELNVSTTPVFTREDLTNVKEVRINDRVFAKENTWSVSLASDNLVITNPEIMSAFEAPGRIVFDLVFADDSKLTVEKVNEVQEPEVPTISSNLENGLYTLAYKVYKEGTKQKEESILASFFDVKAKLEVEGGRKKVTFLNHTYADLILDFALKTDSGYVKFDKEVIKTDKNGGPKFVAYTAYFDSLDGIKEAAILGSGVMQGTDSDIGNYESDKYKKVDIVFENNVEKGFTNFKKVEEFDEKIKNNDKILTEALIENGVDKNNDGAISQEELRNATGIRKVVADVMRENVIDLEGRGISDISMLKDLGPNIKVLNLNANNIEELHENQFDNATGIQYLYLGANPISKVDATSLQGLTELKMIDIDGANLDTLPQGFFDNNKKLTELALVASNITHLPKDLLKNQKRLSALYLQENKIENLDENFFQGQGFALKTVHLHHNNLTNVPTSIKSATDLKILTLNSNNLKRLPSELNLLKNIQILDLSFNELDSIDPKIIENMLKTRATTLNTIAIDLTSNNLTSLPLSEIDSDILSRGLKLHKLEVNLNNLSENPSESDVNAMKQVGVLFDKYVEVYTPQKTSIKPVLVAKNNMVSLSQRFDLLELLYWDMGDSAETVFATADEFENHLLNAAKNQYAISQSVSREQAIKSILDKRRLTWKIENTLKKNGEIISQSISDLNSVDGLSKTFEDSQMRSNDRYDLERVLYIKNPVYGWEKYIKYTTSATAIVDKVSTNDGEEKVQEIDVTALREGTETPSAMTNLALKQKAKYEYKDGKHVYTVALKPIEIGSIRGEVTRFSVNIDGVKTVIEPNEVNGEYPKEYEIKLDKKVQLLPVYMYIAAMSQEVTVDLKFGAVKDVTPPVNNQVKTVKGYILTEDKTKLSMADRALVREVEFKDIAEKVGLFDAVEFKVKFNEMTLGNLTAGVDTLAVDSNGTFKAATKVANGVFTFKAPKFILPRGLSASNQMPDTEIKVQFTTYPKVAGHDKPANAVLVLDWNGDFKAPNSGNTPSPGGGTTPIPGGGTPSVPGGGGGSSTPSNDKYQVPVWLKKKNNDEVSIANKALEQVATVEKVNGKYIYKIKLRPVEINQNGQTLVGNIVAFSIFENGVERVLNPSTNGSTQEFTFESSSKLNQQRVAFVVDIMERLGVGKQEAILIFNWDGNTNAPAGGGGGPQIPLPTEVSTDLEKKATAILENKQAYKAQTLEKVAKALELYKKNEKESKEKLVAVLLEAKIENISNILSDGFVSGYNKDEFRPNQEVSRAELAMMLGNLFESKEILKINDVDEKAYYAKAVSALVSNGIINVYPDNTFKPNKKVTRAELATILARVLELNNSNSDFKDLSKKHWAYGAMSALVDRGILKGYSDKTIKPENTVTRAEAVSMINRAFMVKSKKDKEINFKDLGKKHWAYEAVKNAMK